MSIAEDRESPEHETAAAQLCRVCNVESVESISLYKIQIVAGELTTLAAMLSDCANLQVLEEEQFLPDHMCYRCVELLAQMYEFKRIALQTDLLLRKRYARTQRTKSRSRSHSRSQSLEKTEAQVKPEMEFDTHRSIEISGTDEFVYVLEETDSLENIVSSHEDKESVLEEVPEDQLHFASNEPNVQIFEVDYDMDLADEYDQEHAEVEDGEEEEEEEEEEKEQLNTIAARNVKVRAPQRRKSLNPALQCQICGKQLSTSNSFKYHMQLHGDNRPFVCTICNESFKTRNAYDGHITLHNPNNPNKCKTCGKTYRQASSLRSHLLSHTGVKPFTCDICGKGLTQKSGYKKHMLTHTGEKPHSCDTCGRTFRYSSNLIAHKRSHTRKSPDNLNPYVGRKATRV